LGRRVFGVVKIVKADADEAEALRWTEVHALAERERDAGQLVAGSNRFGRGETAGEDLKLGSLEFEDHGAGNARFFAGGVPDLFGQAANRVFGVFEGDVALEGVLRGDGFGGTVRHDVTVIHAKGELVQAMTVASKVALEGGQFLSAQIADGADAEECESFRGYFADAGQAFDG